MQTRILRSLLVVAAVRGLLGCSVPETAAPAAAAPRERTAQRDRQIERDQRALDLRRQRLQNRVLSDLRKLRDDRGVSPAADISAEAAPKPTELKLLIFGGAHHEVYLGCLCEERNPESVFKLTGEFGSMLSPTSMRNKSAPYGSSGEDTSACNPDATHPPSVIASGGKALGLLTLNASLKKRIAAQSVTGWLARMCSL